MHARSPRRRRSSGSPRGRTSGAHRPRERYKEPSSLASAFGGASIAKQLADGLRASATLAPYADALGLTIVVGAITYLSLVIGELVPKRVALTAPERIASVIARPMRVLSRVVSPLVKLLTGSTNLVPGRRDVPASRADRRRQMGYGQRPGGQRSRHLRDALPPGRLGHARGDPFAARLAHRGE